MGWFEVLALLRRLGPTLARIAPMLEMFVASRGGSRADPEVMDRLAGELAAISRNHAAVVDLLSEQATQTEVNLRHMRDADQRAAARLLEMEMQITALSKAVQQARQLIVTVLVICVIILALLLVLLLHR